MRLVSPASWRPSPTKCRCKPCASGSIWVAYGEAVPFVRLDATRPTGDMAIWLSSQGTAGLTGAEGVPRLGVQMLLDRGVSVIGVDLFGRDEATQPLVANTVAAAYTFGYNPPLLVERVHDVLAAIAYARGQAGTGHRVVLVGLGRAESAWAALARARAEAE